MNQDKVWDYFQNQDPDHFLPAIPRLEFLFRAAKAHQSDAKKRVLNIGVGNGWLEKACAAHGWETYSLDPNAAAVKRLEQWGVNGKAGYISQIPYPDNHFDTVFCTEVLEHLPADEMRQALKEIARTLKERGSLIGTVPFRENLWADEVLCPHCGTIFNSEGHLLSFDLDSLRSYFPSDLRVESTKIKYFVNWSLLNFKGKLLALIKKTLLELGVHGSGEKIFFLARKLP